MDEKRRKQLECDRQESLTLQERLEGWHYCIDWDFMIIGPGMPEMKHCNCDLETYVATVKAAYEISSQRRPLL